MTKSKRLALRKRKLEAAPNSVVQAKSAATSVTDLPSKRRRRGNSEPSIARASTSTADKFLHSSKDKPSVANETNVSFNVTRANMLQQSTTLQPVASGYVKNSKDLPKCISLNYFCQFIDSFLRKKCSTNNSKKRVTLQSSNPKCIASRTGHVPEIFFNNMSDMELKMWKNLHFRELQYYPLHDYMDRQAFLNPRMRAILFDWMTEVCQEYQLKRETLHIALINVDRYLSAVKNLKRSKLQLVGVASLLIASKVEEIYAPRGSEFVMTTDGAYSAQEIFQMEMKMLKVLQWKITPVTTFTWLNLYTRKIHQYCKLRNTLSSNVHYTYAVDSAQQYLERKRSDCNNRAQRSAGIFDKNDDEITSGVQVGSVPGAAAFPTEPFEMIMEKIDLLMLDMNSLQFTPSLITAAMLYYFLPPFMPNLTKENVLEITKYKVHQVKDVMKWASLYLRNFSPKTGPNVRESQYRKDILPFDFYTMQQHHPKALRHYTRVWEKLNEANKSQHLKIHVVVRQYHGRKYDYDASLSASLKQLCKVHSENFGVDINGCEMLFFSGPVFSANSNILDTENDSLTVSDLAPNRRGQTEIFAISRNVYNNINRMKCICYIQDMDTMEQIKSDERVTSKSFGISYSVRQRQFPVFGMKKENAVHNFEVLKHALEKFVTEYQKQFEDLLFMIDGFVIDFSNVNSPLHQTRYPCRLNSDSAGGKLKANSKVTCGTSHISDPRSNSNLKKTPATARKKARRYPQISRSDFSVATRNTREGGLLQLMSNLSGSVVIECYKKQYFGDVYNLRNSPEQKLISDEVLECSDIC